MFKNIGKTIRVLAIVLAVLSFLGFAALGALMLIASMDGNISKDLKTTGLQAAIICFVLCVLLPFLNLILYGFGTLISAAQAQAEDSKKTKEILQNALANGMLPEEIARQSAQAQAKLIAHLLAQNGGASAAPKKNTNAPMQRPISEESVEQAPAPLQPVRTAVPEKETEAAQAPAPAFIPGAKAAPAFIPVAPAAPAFIPCAPAAPFANTDALRPLSDDEETF